jgi:hypothetical protein
MRLPATFDPANVDAAALHVVWNAFGGFPFLPLPLPLFPGPLPVELQAPLEAVVGASHLPTFAGLCIDANVIGEVKWSSFNSASWVALISATPDMMPSFLDFFTALLLIS